jgi:hypothetical protein
MIEIAEILSHVGLLLELLQLFEHQLGVFFLHWKRSPPGIFNCDFLLNDVFSIFVAKHIDSSLENRMV